LSVFQLAQGAKRDAGLVGDSSLVEITGKAQLAEAMAEVMLQVRKIFIHSALSCSL
jgi:hypothetical protein